jgi:homogentisate 1,2-dioxygenase
MSSLTNGHGLNGPYAKSTTKTTPGGSAAGTFVTTGTLEDPYSYQVGFGNRFATEAVPGALPTGGRNLPQRCEYDLYSEQLNATSFISSRQTMQHLWFYRIRPAVAHKPLRAFAMKHDMVAAFVGHNKDVKFTPFTFEWGPLEQPSETEPVNFYQGIRTIAGHGDPTSKEGLAVHQYAASVSMGSEAFVNHDGDFLIIPVQGRLDIQTELGRMMVRPGEFCVIQAGLRFKVVLPDGPVHGYVQEIFGSHYELPDLGPIGSNGLALPRDFEIPVASFDMDSSEWEVVLKLAGELYHYKQNHTPFDVVAWHGNYAPYKYDITKILALSSSKDQLDPSAYCILTAKSKIPGVSLSDFCAFTPKWVNSLDSFRPPYYHRTVASEMMGMVYGTYAGSSKTLSPGALTCDNSYVAHGESYQAWKKATSAVLEPQYQGEASLSFMFHMSSHVGVTKFAMERHARTKPPPEHLWDDLQGEFLNHIPVINKKLTAAGRPPLPMLA